MVLKQDQFNPHRDNAELMIADYYKDAVESNEVPETPHPINNITAEIDISSWKAAKIVIGSSNNVLYGKFRNQGTPVNIPGYWSYKIPSSHTDKFTIRTEVDPDRMIIQSEKDYSLVGSVISVTYHDSTGEHSASQEIEVVAR